MKIILLLIFSVLAAECQEIEYFISSATNNGIYVFSENEIIIGGNLGKLMKTEDAGGHWRPILTKSKEDIMSLEFSPVGRGFFCTPGSIYVSQDKGETWEEVYTSGSEIMNAGLSQDGSSVLFCSGSKLYGLELEGDKVGEIFEADEKINNFYTDSIYFYIVTKGFFYKATKNQLLYKHELKGIYNSSLLSVAANGLNIMIGAVDTVNTGVITRNEIFFTSRDGGFSFDTSKESHGWPKKIKFYGNNFYSLTGNQIIEVFDKNMNTVRFDTADSREYFRTRKSSILIRDIYYFNGGVYFCGRDNSWGNFSSGGKCDVKNFAKIFYIDKTYFYPQKIANLEGSFYTIGNYGTIIRSNDSGVTWNMAFPFDTVSLTQESSPFFKYTEKSAIFNGFFPFTDGYRFVGDYFGNQPLDIALDTLTSTYTDKKQLQFNYCISNNEYFLGTRANKLFISKDNGDSWLEYSFGSKYGLSAVQGPAPEIFYINAKKNLDKKDTIDNPNKMSWRHKFIVFDAQSLSATETFGIDTGEDMVFSTLSATAYGEYLSFGNRKKILIFDSLFRKSGEVDINFFPADIYAATPDNWIAVSNYDSIFITTDRGKAWKEYKIAGGENSEFEESTFRLMKIINVKGDEFIIAGANRLVKLWVKFPPVSVNEKYSPESILVDFNKVVKVQLYDFLGNKLGEVTAGSYTELYESIKNCSTNLVIARILLDNCNYHVMKFVN